MKDKLRYLTIAFLIITFIVLIELFLCKMETAQALQVANPDYQNTVLGSSEVWYGYKLPSRATNDSGALSSSVKVLQTARVSNNWNIIDFRNLKIGLRDLDSDILDYMLDNNIDFSSLSNGNRLWSQTYKNDYTRPLVDHSFVYAFSPGSSYSTDQEVLESGFGINYSSKYSYKFDVIVYNPNLNDTYQLRDSLQTCSGNGQDYNTSCVNYRNWSVEKLVDTPKLQWFRYSMECNQYTCGSGFTYYLITSSSNIYGVGEAQNVFDSFNPIKNSTKVIFSQPYDIVLWNHESSMTCTNTCWTQADTDSNQRILDDPTFVWNALNDIVSNFNYHGFSGIVNLTFDYIINLLRDANTTCVGLNIPVLSTSINLPSSCTFWGRSDVSTFESFVNLLWIGLASYFIGWRVFKDILNVYNPNSKVIDGNEVEDL